MRVGSKIYYDLLTGKIILQTAEMTGDIVGTTVEQDIEIYTVLTERNRDSFDYIQLEYGQYFQDFRESNSYRVNPETKELEFSYPDPNEREPQEPVYQQPLTVEIKDLKEQLKVTQDALDFLVMGGI